jgi:hypothetical protein
LRPIAATGGKRLAAPHRLGIAEGDDTGSWSSAWLAHCRSNP